MSFISPINFVFAGLLGAVVLLYLLRLKRKERVISSTLLWDSALRDLQANAPWQKLRSSLLMWLQLAFLSLAVLALVRPAIQVLASGGQTVAIIMDVSGSMKATDVAPSRFENARAEATRLINALSSGDSATIIAAGQGVRVLAPLTSNANQLKRAVTAAAPQDTACNLRDAIALAGSILRDKRNPQIYILSDGAVPPMQGVDLGKAGMQFVKIGRGADNVAITAMDARRGYSGSNRAQVFVTLSNFSPKPREVNLELSRDGSLVEVRPVTVPAATPATGTGGGTGTGSGAKLNPGTSSQLFDGLAFESGLFSARFDARDDLATDNFAWARLDPPRPIRVLLTSDNLFLEKALNVNPNVRLFGGTQGGGDSFDVVVCDGAVPAGLEDANQLLFNTTQGLSPVDVSGTAAQPTVADYDRKHPVSRYAPWNDIRFSSAMAAQPKPWARPIVEAERTPLVVAGERTGRRVVWCGFNLRETDLPLRVAFPIFIANALEWLTAPRTVNPAGAPADNTAQRAGFPVPVYPPAAAKTVTITRPDKKVVTLPAPQAREGLMYDGADQVGVYTATSGEWKQPFAVSLLSRAESDIAPQANLNLGDAVKVDANNKARANLELWGYLITAALVVLMVEWWVYHRGT